MDKRKERLQKLVDLLMVSENLHVKDAAKRLGVSEMTIRRDIQTAVSPTLYLLGGHVVLGADRKNVSHYFLSIQQKLNITAKKHIGRLAANLIKEGDTIFFDCGTTTPYIIEYIPNTIHFTAVCYSLNVFMALQRHENCKVILCGGQFEADNAIFLPLNDQSPLDIICPSKSFISAAGISLKGVTCFNWQEVLWKRKSMHKSNTTIVVADYSKFDRLKTAYIAPLSDFDILITDTIDDVYLAYCQKNNVTVIQ